MIPGVVAALAVLGVSVDKVKNYYDYKQLFPESGVVEIVVDGDTVELKSGVRVRLLGVNAPDRGEKGFEESMEGLKKMVEKQKVWLEYDRYQDDKNGRVLAYLWIKCESSKPKFLAAEYMHLDGKTSKDYVTETPEGCKNGEMVNRKMVDEGLAKSVVYEGRGRLKYNLNPSVYGISP